MIMTDADVDGSHIRTLLLTLFYRRNTRLIERGYLYIAQPPLYKLTTGGKETYMKDDEEFERFIMQRSTEKVKCFIRDKEVGRERLRDDVQNLRNVEKYLEQLERLDINRALILALFNADIYKREDFEGPDKLQALRERLVSAGYGAEVVPDPEHNLYTLKIRNAKTGHEHVVDNEFCSQEDYKGYYRVYKRIAPYFEDEIKVLNKDGSLRATTADAFLAHVNDKGKEGITIQRYKGLGEMNPEQLWTTTMDPEKRTLLRVSIDDAILADQMFTVLMGTNVESRRAFIEENSLDVRNLDI